MPRCGAAGARQRRLKFRLGPCHQRADRRRLFQQRGIQPSRGNKGCPACNNRSGCEEAPVEDAIEDALTMSCTGNIDNIGNSKGATLRAGCSSISGSGTASTHSSASPAHSAACGRAVPACTTCRSPPVATGACRHRARSWTGSTASLSTAPVLENELQRSGDTPHRLLHRRRRSLRQHSGRECELHLQPRSLGPASLYRVNATVADRSIGRQPGRTCATRCSHRCVEPFGR